MSRHVVFGAGEIGRAVAHRLVAGGVTVVLASRSGTGPVVPGVQRLAVDASDEAAVAGATEGASAIYNCVNPAYHRWPTDWPPIAGALLGAAERSGAVLVTVSNLYGYGRVTGPMTESFPLAATGRKGQVRAAMYEQALAAHEAGRVRMVEVRASDYIGPAAQGFLVQQALPRLLAGRSVSVLGSPDQPHTYTYTGDVADLAIGAAADPSSWGSAWHVPSNPPVTQRQVIADLAAAAGVPAPQVRTLPNLLVRSAGIFSPLLRELQETRYQWTESFVMDSEAAQRHFGVAPTPWDEIVRRTVAGQREATAA